MAAFGKDPICRRHQPWTTILRNSGKCFGEAVEIIYKRIHFELECSLHDIMSMGLCPRWSRFAIPETYDPVIECLDLCRLRNVTVDIDLDRDLFHRGGFGQGPLPGPGRFFDLFNNTAELYSLTRLTIKMTLMKDMPGRIIEYLLDLFRAIRCTLQDRVQDLHVRVASCRRCC